jgi:hypothetical protein
MINFIFSILVSLNVCRLFLAIFGQIYLVIAASGSIFIKSPITMLLSSINNARCRRNGGLIDIFLLKQLWGRGGGGIQVLQEKGIGATVQHGGLTPLYSEANSDESS